MTKGGVMIGSTVSTRSERLTAKAGARHDQREGEAEHRRADAEQHAEEQRVPGDAAAAAAGRQPRPQIAVDQALEQQRRREGAVAVLEGAAPGCADRQEDEEHDRAPRPSVTAPATKASPPKAPRAASPWQRSEQQRDQRRARRQRRCRPAAPRAAEQRGEPVRGPAAQADAEALRDDQREAAAPPADQQERRRAARARPAAARSRHRPRAPAAPAAATICRARRPGARPERVVFRRPQAGEPGARVEAVLQRVPGQEAKPEPAERPTRTQRSRAVSGAWASGLAAARRPRRPTSPAGACARPTSRTWRSRSRSA